MNGYKNYQTWDAALWLHNEECTYKYYRSLAAELYEQQREDRSGTVTELARILQEDIEDGNPIEGASLYSDIMTAGLQAIDYEEVAESFLDE